MEGIGRRFALAMAGKKNPWGGEGGSDSPAPPESGSGTAGGTEGPDPAKPGTPRGPRNPWLPPESDGGRRPPSLDEIFKTRGNGGGGGGEGPRFGGGGPGFRLPPRSNGKSWFPLAVGAIAAIWLFATSFHQIGIKEQGIVTWFGGKYSGKLEPGFRLSAPWPIQNVTTANVSEINGLRIGTEGQKLILTGDQNLVDLSYLVRWKINDLPLYTYQLEDPETTLREVAEAAMRASVAEQRLDDVVSGAGRAEIEAAVQLRMQATLNAYRSGILIKGVAIEKADPPEKTVEAFKEVSAAQQEANAMRNRARAYAQQVLARAQGDAASFDEIYAQYKLAPEVTRRRLYYETMESVLGKVDKTVVETGGVTSYLPLPEVKRSQPSAQPTKGVQ